MRDAQALSKHLESSIKKLTGMSLNLQKERTKLMTQIDSQIQQLTKNKESHQLEQLQQLQQLLAEKDVLLAHHNQIMNVPNFNLSSIGNEKEDLVEKLQVVEDLQKNMIQKIAFLKNELSEEKSREFLRNEVSHFIDEENFFGEQSFISSGLNRKDSSKIPAFVALKKDASASNNASPSATDPTSIPVSGDTSPTTQSPETPSSNTAPSNTADSSATAPTPTSSESTSFQQPQEIGNFETLLSQVQETIRDTNVKNITKKPDPSSSSKSKKFTYKTKRGVLEQNIALSQKIMTDLEILRQNLTQQIHSLD